MEEEKNPLILKYEHLTEWLKKTAQAVKLIPLVQRELEITEWEVEVMKNLPSEASDLPIDHINTQYKLENAQLAESLPMPPNYEPNKLYQYIATTTSGSSDTFAHVTRVGGIGTPITSAFSDFFTKQYEDIQLKHTRVDDIKNFLKNINENTLKRFLSAESSYYQFKSGTIEASAAGMEIRKFIDGLKGDLFQIARNFPKENMTWNRMAERFSNGDISSHVFSTVNKAGNDHNALFTRLTDIGKDRISGFITNIDFIWTQVLDHAYTLLIIVDVYKNSKDNDI